MRILYVNHTAKVSGGEHSLLALLAGLPDTVDPIVASPEGSLSEAVRRLGIPTLAIAGTDGSLRLHPLHTPRAVAEMSITAFEVRRAARRHCAELVHANSIRAGIILALARLARSPTVVHVRECLPRRPVSTAALRLIAATATTIIANSEYTARSVRAAAPGARVQVVYNPVDLDRWDPARVDRTQARAALGGVGERELLLGVVAQLTPWKGQDTAIEALKLLCEEGIDAHLLLIGSAKFVARATRFDNEGYVNGLRALVAEAGLEHRVSWLGEREDVPELVRALDVLLLPSWEEPFGRAVIEAMALGVPVVATSVGGPAEIIENGYDGYLVPPHKPEAWARVLRRFAEDQEHGEEMGRAGRRRVEEFSVGQHVGSMLDVYKQATAAFAHA